MEVVPLLLEDLNFKSFRIKSPQMIDRNFKTQELTYLIDQKKLPVIIRTPRLYLPFGLSKAYQSDDKWTLNLTFKNSDQKTEKFKREIEKLDHYFSKGFSHYSYYPSLRQNDDRFYPPYLRAKISSILPCQVYDIYSKQQDLNYIVPGSWATCLLYLKHVWINEIDNLVGLSWFVLQAKVKTPVPILNTCLINDDWSKETLCAICHDKVVKETCVQGVVEPIPDGYEKYFKMLKLGIPILAVIQRCQMDEKDPEVITQRHAPPPPPPLPEHNQLKSNDHSLEKRRNQSNVPPKVLFSAQDLLNSKAQLGKNKKHRQVNLQKKDPRVPTLEMILKGRGNLKKVPYQKIINNIVVP